MTWRRPNSSSNAIGSSHSDPNYAPDRSAYLCNYLGYNLAEGFRGTTTAAGFVHVTGDTPADQMHVLLEAVVAYQLDRRRAAAPPQS